MIELEDRHMKALVDAQESFIHSDFCPYFDLKRMLRAIKTKPGDKVARGCFRDLFTRFYAMNAAGLTQEFRSRYFQLLFKSRGIENGKPNLPLIFEELRKADPKDHRIQFAFVSKLVNIHVESSPIWDTNVLRFFGKNLPFSLYDRKVRIAWFVKFLSELATTYLTWAEDARVKAVLENFKSRDAQLGQCHVVRLMDFLVWKAGKLSVVSSAIPDYYA